MPEIKWNWKKCQFYSRLLRLDKSVLIKIVNNNTSCTIQCWSLPMLDPHHVWLCSSTFFLSVEAINQNRIFKSNICLNKIVLECQMSFHSLKMFNKRWRYVFRFSDEIMNVTVKWKMVIESIEMHSSKLRCHCPSKCNGKWKYVQMLESAFIWLTSQLSKGWLE